MLAPPLPAEILREDIFPELNISEEQAAKELGISSITMNKLLAGEIGISAEIAIRLHLWLGENSPSAESWLNQQANYDLWQAKTTQNFQSVISHDYTVRHHL